MCPRTAFDVRSRGFCHPLICNRSVQSCYLPDLTADQPITGFKTSPCSQTVPSSSSSSTRSIVIRSPEDREDQLNIFNSIKVHKPPAENAMHSWGSPRISKIESYLQLVIARLTVAAHKVRTMNGTMVKYNYNGKAN